MEYSFLFKTVQNYKNRLRNATVRPIVENKVAPFSGYGV